MERPGLRTVADLLRMTFVKSPQRMETDMADAGLIAPRTPAASPLQGVVARHRALVLLVVLPAALSILAGWMQPGRTAEWPLALALGYYAAINIGSWVGAHLASGLIARPLGRLGAPFWLILTIGFVLGCHLGVTAGQGYILALRAIVPDLSGLATLPRYFGDIDSLIIALPIWVGSNALMRALAGWPTHGLAPPGWAGRAGADAPSASRHDEDAAAETRIIARLKPAARGRIRAMRAEQNYVRIFTVAGDDLILGSLAGLAGQLGARGVQVHRSWWVATDAVEGLSRTAGGQDVVTIAGGLEAPIGRTFRREALARLASSAGSTP
jgi:hypothetical protein